MLTCSLAARVATYTYAFRTPIFRTSISWPIAEARRRPRARLAHHRCKIKHYRIYITQATRKTHYQQMWTVLRHCAGQ